jgi:hypothetical protein
MISADGAYRAADQLTTQLLDEADTCGQDRNAVVYDVWIFLTRYLSAAGWTPEELMRDAGWHSAHQSSDGGVS